MVVSALCHDIETAMEETNAISDGDIARLTNAWRDVSSTVNQVVGEDSRTGMLVGESEYAAIVDSIVNGVPRPQVLAAIVKWKLEPVERRLTRFADQATRIAKRLGKDVEIVTEPNEVRLSAEAWAPVWSSLVHVIRNALDHGIETGEERAAQGKSPKARLCLRVVETGPQIAVEVVDDGRGINWEALAQKAKAANMAHASRADLIEAIFADGVSTKETATELSGRGVGMAAVRMACRDLGGDVQIESEPNGGTTVRCLFPNGVKFRDNVIALPVARCANSLVPAPLRQSLSIVPPLRSSLRPSCVPSIAPPCDKPDEIEIPLWYGLKRFQMIA
jgi:two-component sensor histidine kinase